MAGKIKHWRYVRYLRPFLIARNGSAQDWLPFKGPAPGRVPGNLVTVRARRERSFERSGYRRNAHFYDRPTFSHCDMRELLPPGCALQAYRTQTDREIG